MNKEKQQEKKKEERKDIMMERTGFEKYKGIQEHTLWKSLQICLVEYKIS